MLVERYLTAVGQTALLVARETGGIVILLVEVLRALVPPRIDRRAL